MKKGIEEFRYEQLNKAIDKYIKAFEKKHNIKFDYWISRTGTIAVCGDYYFDFNDIRTDLDEDAQERKIFDWYDEELVSNLKQKPFMNYKNYLKCH